MASYIALALATWFAIWATRTWLALRHNIAKAKATGIPYRVSPLSGIPGYIWMATHELFLVPLRDYIPASRKWMWPKLLHIHRSWFYHHELREELGELYLIVSPQPQIYLSVSNAEAVTQICTRKNDFIKPVEIYAIMDIFGPSILTTEGAEWRRHRKIVAPAFSEKSNSLVWRESLRQATGMLELWSRAEGNDADVMKVENTAPYTALLALHVICAAGFGVRQLWDGEDEKELGTNVVPGFNTAKLTGSHQLTFKDSLNTLLHDIIWLAIFPTSMIRKSPFGIHQKLTLAFSEVGSYFSELSAWKQHQLATGATTEKGTMDIMGPLVSASQLSPSENPGAYLTHQEVISDSWVALFAGHETSANITHLCLIFLAIDLPLQGRVQESIDEILGYGPSSSWSYETDLGKLWNSILGATIQETLRLMPPVIDIPKIVRHRAQELTVDGKTVTVPENTIMHLSTMGVHRNPRYWPTKPSLLSSKPHDLDDFVSERWLSGYAEDAKVSKEEKGDGEGEEEPPPFDKASTLFTTAQGAFMPFSEGARSCPGKRFAQVEITAILATIFRDYTVELDVSKWARDHDIAHLAANGRRAVYERAMEDARTKVRGSKSEIFLQMRDMIPVRFVKRGGEGFGGCF